MPPLPVIAMAPEVALSTKCLWAAIAFVVTCYAWNRKSRPTVFRSVCMVVALISLTAGFHFLMQSRLMPVTYLGYEVAQRSGELAILTGFWFGLLPRWWTARQHR